MQIGVLEILGAKPNNAWDYGESFLVRKQYSGLTAQSVSVWCRQMGHQVVYATHYGIGDPLSKLPENLDILFVSSFTYTAATAYAIGRIFQRKGTLTILGGPHAKAFPIDSQRFFDLVVMEVDRDLVASILAKKFKPGSIISSQEPYRDVPTVEERMPEIKRSAYVAGKILHPGAFIPLLTSMGCPYSCDFCVDWDNPYYLLSKDRLQEDLHYIAENLPGITLAIHDPNFAVQFDKTMDAFESVPPEKRSGYAVESSLTVLRPKRLERLRDTNCLSMTPGIESWSKYSNKAGVGSAVNGAKLKQLVEHFHILREYIPYLGANFIFGLDTDEGDEPFELTKEFIRRLPFVWASLNTPVPFGGSPLYDQALENGDILQQMPFFFYNLPYIAFILKNYEPIPFYEKLAGVFELAVSDEMLKRRKETSRGGRFTITHYIRSFTVRQRLISIKKMLKLLKTDQSFLDFHLGKKPILPDFYKEIYRKQMGKYIELVPLEESQPIHASASEVASLVVS